MRFLLLIFLLIPSGRKAEAQSEDVLRRFFEGRSVLVKLEMPGSDDGVDVYPGTSRPIDFPKHARRLKQFGTAIRRGEEVLVTKVKVKQDLIEVQLGGGGYGTFGDETSSNVSTGSTPKTEREKNLESSLPTIVDPAARKQAKEELDGLRKERNREDAANRARAQQAEQIKEANIRQRRAESGSRFNLRFKPAVPDEAMTPGGIMRALAEYVDFSPLLAAGRPGLHGEGALPGPEQGVLRKGLTVDEVDAMLGRPEAIDQRMEGSLKVSRSTYRQADRVIEAEFVEGVLIRFFVRSS